MHIFNGATGEIIREMPSVGPVYRLLLSRLRQLLSQGIDVQWGKTLEYFSCDTSHRSVTATFSDGSTVKGRLLVGTDGAHSRVRRLLFADDPARAELVYLPYEATFVNASFTREQALKLHSSPYHPLLNVIVHPSGRMGFLATMDAHDEEHPETWCFTFYIGRKIDKLEKETARVGARERLMEVKQLVRDESWAEPLRSVYDHCHDDTETVYYTRLANWNPALEEHRWDNRRGLVTLAGDAAHPMTYRECSSSLH
jgi:2-polyprenyl-6-methoxyphenol hydroxylase-like FAD-dependent oxidoreductase